MQPKKLAPIKFVHAAHAEPLDEPGIDPVVAGVANALRKQAWRPIDSYGRADTAFTWIRVLRGHAFVLHGNPEGHDIDTVDGRLSLAREVYCMALERLPHASAHVPVTLAAAAVAEATGHKQRWSALPMLRRRGEVWWEDVLWGLVHREAPRRLGVHVAPRRLYWGHPEAAAEQQRSDQAYTEAFRTQLDWLTGGG